MADVDLQAMTIDELDELSVDYKHQIEAIRDKRRIAKKVRDEKVLLDSLARRLNIDVTGITPEHAKALLEIARLTPPREGDVVIEPGPGDLRAELTSPEVEP